MVKYLQEGVFTMEIKTTDVKKSPNKKLILGIIIGVCSLVVIYLGISLLFIGHFSYGTSINGVNVSCKKVQDVKKEIAAKSQNYELCLEERGGSSEIIKGADIGLKYDLGDSVEKLKKAQNPYGWIAGFFHKQSFDLKENLNYDENLLQETLKKLECLKEENIVQPKNAALEFNNNQYSITPEVEGNKLNEDELLKGVVSAIVKGETSMNLEELNYYEKAQYVSTSKEIVDAKALLDKYISTNITYNFGDRSESLNGSTISTWLKVDENYQVSLDEAFINSYVDNLASTYNTCGIARQFATSSGTTATVQGGDYGWILDKETEVAAIKEALNNGETITKEPSYVQSAASRNGNDIGNTYVEINLTSQYLWFYKDGQLIAEGNVVTGTNNTKYATPQGIYALKYLEKNAILRGPGYAAPVSFWMPFNWDIGLHDATWRGSFGGSIYQYDGSHGCVNLPYSVAEAIFNNIYVGAPVVCYY